MPQALNPLSLIHIESWENSPLPLLALWVKVLLGKVNEDKHKSCYVFIELCYPVTKQKNLMPFLFLIVEASSHESPLILGQFSALSLSHHLHQSDRWTVAAVVAASLTLSPARTYVPRSRVHF